MTRACPALLVFLVLGCDHAEPFAVSDPAEDGPFVPGQVVRLTYGTGISPAAWLPGADTVVLAARSEDRDEGDVCLVLLPASGGTRSSDLCSHSYQQGDSVEVFRAPAVSPDREVAYPYFHRRSGGSTFGSLRTLALGSASQPTDVNPIPFASGARVFQEVSDLAWQPDGSLVFIGWTDEVLEKTCGGLPCDELVRIPFGVMRTSGGAPAVLPGTYLATSATPDGNGGLFATFPNSDELWRISTAGDSVAVHDFGPGSKVRGADHQAGKVAVVVRGTHSVAVDDIGVFQTSSGFGELVVLDLPSGTVTRIGPQDMLFRDPALSTDGRAVVAIGSAFTVTPRSPGSPIMDTTYARPLGDLWRMNLP